MRTVNDVECSVADGHLGQDEVESQIGGNVRRVQDKGRLTVRLGRIALAIAGWLVLSCGTEQYANHDTLPPAPIADLLAGYPSGSSMALTWSASGDDADSGQAMYYDIRYATDSLTADNWESAERVPTFSRPFRTRSRESFAVTGLARQTRYYFGVRTADEIPNWSPLSNITSSVTAGSNDSIPPAAITDLAVTDSTSYEITLEWSATGDDSTDGRALLYDLRFSVLPIRDEVDWDYSAILTPLPRPLAAGSHHRHTVSGLVPNRRFFFALRAADEALNWSAIPLFTVGRTMRPELIPPAAIRDLRVTAVSTSWVELTWTAPGDDSISGLAVEYDLRYSSYIFVESNWDNGARFQGEPHPMPPGSVQHAIIPGLRMLVIYYFAIMTSDEVPNWSVMSNVVGAIPGVGPVRDST